MNPAARLGDSHACPKCGPNTIVTASGGPLREGTPVALVGDTTACGATILTGSAACRVNGRPVAMIGSKTSHGGTITSGSSQLRV
ncbi:MAG: PAAR domain-containing protein [Vannielia sp.]|uniref:PAAR domain-containing protein n=1 Tax=Vannielia sp. TaxID=2813045 RepID=UPI003B8CDE5A